MARVIVALALAFVALPGAARADISVTEGAAFSGRLAETQLCSGAAPSVTVTWGDGRQSAGTYTNSPPSSTYAYDGTHTYAKAGTYHGSLQASWTCNATPSSATFTFTATVADAALSASPAAIAAEPGVVFSGVVAHVADANPEGAAADDHATIAWGDGAGGDGTVVAAPGGGFDVRGTHTYAAAGTYAVHVTVGDTGSSTTATTSTATVAAAPPPTTTIAPSAPAPPLPTPAPAVTARIATVSSAPGTLVLDAAASVPAGATAARYTWNLGGGPDADIVCPGTAPRLTIAARAGRSTTATLQAADATSGAVTTARLAVTIPAPPHRAGARAAATRAAGFTVDGLCTPDAPPAHAVPPLKSTHLPAGSRPPIANAGGAPPDDCGDHLVFGAADVRGCLSQIPDPDALPGGITVGLAKLLCGAKDGDFCLGGLTQAAGVLGSALTARAAAISTPKVAPLLGALAYPSYYTYSAIRLNGVDLVPQGGAPILIIPAAQAIVAAQVKVYLGGRLLLPTAIPLGLYVPSSGGHLGDLTLPKQVPLIGSLPFTGSIGIDLLRAHRTAANGTTCQYACAALSVQAELPGVLSDDSGHGLSAAGVITADAVDGVQLDSLEVKVPSAQLAGVGVSDVDVSYHHADQSLHAAATFDLFDVAGTIGGSIDFSRGRFTGASLEWTAGDGPGIDLGGPLNIYLTRLGGSIALDPTVLSANGAITGGPQALGCSLLGIDGDLTVRFGPFSLDADADGSFLCQHVSHEYFHVDDAGSIRLGAQVDLHLLFFEITGGLDVAGDVNQGHLQADANLGLCLDLLGTHCLGAEAVVSDRGIGVCADLGFTHAGGGLQFPDHVLTFFDTCDIGKFRSLGYVTAAGDGPGSFTVLDGQPVAAIGLVGSGAAPRATLVGPDGRQVVIPADGYLRDAHTFVAADDAGTHTTYILIDHPAAGTWKIEPAAGSAPILHVEQAAGLPAPDVHARVLHGVGGHLRLAYTLHRAAGQAVTFSERDRTGAFRQIGTARAASGTLALAPSAELATGSRAIVAQVVQDGRPREQDVVAHYAPPAPAPLPAPRGLRATRHGTAVAIRWHAVPGATGYTVVLAMPGGVHRAVRTAATHVTLPGVRRDQRASVQVSALRAGRRAHVGHAARTTLAAGRAPGRVVVRPLT